MIIKMSADASSYGLGTVLLQRKGDSDSWKPVAYSSRAHTEAECHYAKIEKEALMTTWMCEKFAEYIWERRYPLKQTINLWCLCSVQNV